MSKLIGSSCLVLTLFALSCGSDNKKQSSAERRDSGARGNDAEQVAADSGEADAAPSRQSDASTAGAAENQAGAGGTRATAGNSGNPAAGSGGVAAHGGGGRSGAGGTAGAAGEPAAGSGGSESNAGSPSSVCSPGETRSCYTGPDGTRNVGACRDGMQTCLAGGAGYSECSGQVLPAAVENCSTPQDDDCDGVALESDAGCLCEPGSQRACYDGPANTRDVGMCHSGTQTCAADGKSYGSCQNQTLPAAESCDTPGDEDCNGTPNDTCSCQPGEMRDCYSAPPATQNVGVCHGAQQTCNAQGTGFGPCTGEVVPQPETCNTPTDDDCNGQTNESGAGCVCVPNSTSSCYSGPQGTQNVGVCVGGTRTCNAQGTGFGPCTGEVVPQAETCSTPTDDNCNGQTNESGAGCVCVPNSTSSCYSGPQGTQNVGMCHGGTHSCNAQGTSFGACGGEVVPAASENCNTPGDDNCNGQVNEGCTAAVSYATSVQPILQAHCSPCHTTRGFGGANFAAEYSGTQLSAGYCPGLTKGACTIVRIQNGTMPQGAGCTGNPANDASNSACLNAAEQATIQAWISGGQAP